MGPMSNEQHDLRLQRIRARMKEKVEENKETTKLLIDIGRDAARTFDHSFLAVATGAFGLTMFFLKDDVLLPSNLTVLMWSWGLFAAAIVLNLMGFLFNQQMCAALVRQIEEDTTTNTGTIETVERCAPEERARFPKFIVALRRNALPIWENRINWCNWTSILLLAVAFGCWVWFARDTMLLRSQQSMAKQEERITPQGPKEDKAFDPRIAVPTRQPEPQREQAPPAIPPPPAKK